MSNHQRDPERLDENILVDQLFTLKPLVDAVGVEKAAQVATQLANQGKHNDIIPILRNEERKLTGGAPAPPAGGAPPAGAPPAGPPTGGAKPMPPANPAAIEREKKLLEKKEKEAKKKLEKERKEKEKKEKKEKEKQEKEAKKREKQEKKEREKREKMEKEKKAAEAQAKKETHPLPPGHKKDEPSAEHRADAPPVELNINGDGDRQVNIPVGENPPQDAARQNQAPPPEAADKAKDKHTKSKDHPKEHANAGAPPPPPPPLDPLAEKVRQTEEELARKYNFRQDTSGVAPSATGEFRMVYDNFVAQDGGVRRTA